MKYNHIKYKNGYRAKELIHTADINANLYKNTNYLILSTKFQCRYPLDPENLFIRNSKGNMTMFIIVLFVIVKN